MPDLSTPNLIDIAYVSARGQLREAVDRFLDETRPSEVGGLLRTLSALWALSQIIRLKLPATNDGGFYAMQVLGQDGADVDVDTLPPDSVLVGRWITAAANDDLDQAESLFLAASDEDAARLIPALLQLVGAILRDLDPQETGRG